MKFRKKPIIIEAEQWFPEKEIEGVQTHIEDVLGTKVLVASIVTLEGIMRVKNGDWVITGIKGEKYPCRDDIFRKTYEEVL